MKEKAGSRFAATFTAGLIVAGFCLGQNSPVEKPAEGTAVQAVQKSSLSIEQRGDLMMARKMFREAIEIYREGLKEPNSWVYYNKIGIAYHHLMDFKAARKHYEQAIKKNRKYSEAINNLGALYYAQKDYKRAIREYERALKINPYSATIYSNLGTALYARKKYDEALKAYRKALELDPMVFEQRGTAGSILQERSVEELAKFHYYLARSYAQAGMTELALRYIRRSLEEGFKDRKRFLEDPEFAALQDLPEFQELMKMEIRAL